MADVELDVFSGRPNPRWTLSPAQRADLIDQLRAGTIPLLAADSGESRLGYRGFILHFEPAELRLLGTPATTNRAVRVRSGTTTPAGALSGAPAGASR